MIRSSPCGKLNGGNPKTPNICFEIITPHLWKQNHTSPFTEQLGLHLVLKPLIHKTLTVLRGKMCSLKEKLLLCDHFQLILNAYFFFPAKMKLCLIVSFLLLWLLPGAVLMTTNLLHDLRGHPAWRSHKCLAHFITSDITTCG